MHYYQHNIGDYARDTSHLSVIEHGIYRLLLDWCYLNESPITTEKAMRVGRGYPTETQLVLAEFFVCTDEGWRHKRVMSEVEKFRRKAEKNRVNGGKGGRPKATNNPVGFQTVSEQNPAVTLTKNQEPRTNKEQESSLRSDSSGQLFAEPVIDPEKQAKEDATVQGIIDAYNAFADRNPGCKRTEVVTAKLRRKLLLVNNEARKLVRARGWQMPMREFWQSYFEECEADDWLAGRVANPRNARWKQNLEVLVDDTRFRQIMDSAIAAMRSDTEVAA